MEIVFKLIAAAASIATICNVIFTIKINRKVKKVEEEIKEIYTINGNGNKSNFIKLELYY